MLKASCSFKSILHILHRLEYLTNNIESIADLCNSEDTVSSLQLIHAWRPRCWKWSQMSVWLVKQAVCPSGLHIKAPSTLPAGPSVAEPSRRLIKRLASHILFSAACEVWRAVMTPQNRDSMKMWDCYRSEYLIKTICSHFPASRWREEKLC